MIREEIEKAVEAWDWDSYGNDTFDLDGIIDFAVAMVRKNNDELAAKWIANHGFDKFGVAEFIRNDNEMRIL